MKSDIYIQSNPSINKIRHPLVNGIGGISAALENIKTNPDLAERLLQLALEKFRSLLETLDKEGKRK